MVPASTGDRPVPHRDRRGAAVSEVGLRPLPVEGPLHEHDGAPGRQGRLPQQQDPGRRRRSGLGLLDSPTCGARTSWTSRYPDPAALVTEMHAANVHLDDLDLAAVPDDGDADEGGRARQLQRARRHRRAVCRPQRQRHAPFLRHRSTPMARTLVYQQIHDRLLGKYGWDAIWADNTEPQAYPDPVNVHAADDRARQGRAVPQRLSAASTHAALYEGWRGVGPSTDKRVYVLTRSAFAGQQRYATACWSGDINCDFPDLRQADARPGSTTPSRGCPTGPPTSAATSEATSTGARPRTTSSSRAGSSSAPSARSSASTARARASCTTTSGAPRPRRISSKIDKLRYRLMPYIYSLAWKVTSEGYTMMRHLVFDYPNDTQRLQHQGPVHVRSRLPGQPGDRRGRDQPLGLSAGGDLVRLLDGLDGDRRERR